jgi:capsular polysaccharide biosynthesis protein/Mrp family chromosome partitioning ATPase
MNPMRPQHAAMSHHFPEDGALASPSAAARSTPADSVARTFFRLDLLRSLQLHRGLALGMALVGAALAAAYWFAAEPVYVAQSIVSIRPTMPRIVEQGANWPYDSTTYESYIQQQMQNVTRADVLSGALHKLDPGFWRQDGESEQAAVERMRQLIEVSREGTGYQLSIEAHASDPAVAARLANAVAASFLASASHEQKAGSAQRLAVLGEERDRVKKALAADRAEQETLNRKPGVAASGTAPFEPQRSNDLAIEIVRLQNRYTTVDEEWRNLMLEEGAPGSAVLSAAAVAPLHPLISGVARNAALIVLAGLLLAILAAVCAHKMDPRIYIAADVERVLGFALMAQLPDFVEVSDGVAEEYLLRLAAAIEYGCKQGNLKSCIFTGAGAGAGVTTVATRVRDMLAAMGRATVLLDTSRTPFPASRSSSAGNSQPGIPADRYSSEGWKPGVQALGATQRGSGPMALLQQMGEESQAQDESLVFTDAAPLVVSAETECMLRYVDCAIVVIESGVTTRAQLRAVAAILQRLDAAAVGFVLNRIGWEKADRAFRLSVLAIEEHLQSQGGSMARRMAASRPPAVEDAPAKGPYSMDAAALVQSEPVVPERPALPAVPERVSPPVRRTSQTRGLTQRMTNPDSDLPWWLANLNLQPGELRPAATDPQPLTAAPKLHPEPPPRFWTPPAQSWEGLPDMYDTAMPGISAGSSSSEEPKPGAGPKEVQEPELEETASSLASRLSGLRSLFSVLGMKGRQQTEEPAEKDADAVRQSDFSSIDRPTVAGALTAVPASVPAAGNNASSALPGPPAEAPEFLSPKPRVEQAKKKNSRAGSFRNCRDRLDEYDDVQTLPSWRGQYKKK